MAEKFHCPDAQSTASAKSNDASSALLADCSPWIPNQALIVPPSAVNAGFAGEVFTDRPHVQRRFPSPDDWRDYKASGRGEGGGGGGGIGDEPPSVWYDVEKLFGLVQ